MILDLAPQRSTILALLTAAGPDGLPLGKLRAANTPSGKRYLAALQQLVAEQVVSLLREGNNTRYYVLAVHFNPLERAYQGILKAAAGRGGIPLLTGRDLVAKLLAGAVRQQGDQALRLLVQEGRLVAAKVAKQGGATYYFDRDLLDPRPSPLPPPPLVTREAVRGAYRKLVQEKRDGDIILADLHGALGKPNLVEFQSTLRTMGQEGGVVFGLGDASLASREEREAGLLIDGRRYLCIRLMP